MTTVKIAALVEGDGEVAAVPVLLRRVINSIDPSVTPIVPRGFRHSAGRLLRPGGLERAISAVSELYANHAILVVIDSDDDCPAQLGRHLLERATSSRPDLCISVVLACREYEAWFLAGAESLAGKRSLSQDLLSPPNAEAIRDAKRWLTDRMQGSAAYSATQDQAALTAVLDLEIARKRSRSLRKLWKEVESIMRIAAER
jgi:hypothetical protein